MLMFSHIFGRTTLNSITSRFVANTTPVRNIFRRGRTSPLVHLYIAFAATYSTSGRMSFSQGDGYGGAGLHYSPTNPDSSLIFMHGLGDTAHGWQDIAQIVAQANLGNRTRIILPTAEERPVTINMRIPMPAWFDIMGLEEGSPEDREGILKSKDRIVNIIHGEVKRGINPMKIIVGGFSQGGALAYIVGLTSLYNLGGIVALSCWCPLADEIQISDTVATNPIPVLHCHGKSDELVQYSYGQATVNKIREKYASREISEDILQKQIVFKSYDGMGHHVCPTEFSDIVSFLKEKMS